MRVGLVVSLVLSLALLTGCEKTSRVDDGSSADLVVIGDVHTMNPSAPTAEAIAVSDGRLVFVGTAAQARKLLKPGGKTIELKPGQMVLPGLVDSHVHMLDAGVAQLTCTVSAPKTMEALTTKLAACAADSPDKPWFLGSGWPAPLFGESGPTKQELDAIVPNRPAVIWGEDGHSAWLNSAALRAANIGPDTPDPPRGRIERVPGGTEPSGTLREAAMDLVLAVMPPTSPEQYAAGLDVAQRKLHSYGITLVQDANVDPRMLAAYHDAAVNGKLTMKVVAAQYVDPRKPASQVDELIKLRDQNATGRFTAGTAKIFLDGVMESGTAAMLEPYVKSERAQPDRGTLNWSPAALTEIVKALVAAGFQIHMHSIGDAALREGLDALAVASQTNGSADLRHQIAHLELADPADIPRLAALGVFADFQPYWFYADPSITQSTEALIGPERTARLYQMGSFERAGVRLVAGSDWPVSTPDPFLAIQVGMTRRDPSDPNGSVWNPDQRVSLDTLLKAYTIEGATVNHREKDTGSLEAGKAADFITIDRNLFQIPPEEIGKTRVLATFLDGQQVYAADS